RVGVVASIGAVLLLAFFAGLRLKTLTVINSAPLDYLRATRILLIVAIAVALLRLYTRINSQIWAVGACMLIVFDLLTFSHGYTPFHPKSMIFPPAPVFDLLSAKPGPFRVLGLEGSTGINWEQMYGLDDAGGYDFQLETLYQVTADLRSGPDEVSFPPEKILAAKHRIVDLLNVKYLTAPTEGSASPLLVRSSNRFKKVATTAGIHGTDVIENMSVLPRAFTVPDRGIEVIPSEKGALIRIRDPLFDPLKNVLLSESWPQSKNRLAHQTDANAQPEI